MASHQPLLRRRQVLAGLDRCNLQGWAWKEDLKVGDRVVVRLVGALPGGLHVGVIQDKDKLPRAQLVAGPDGAHVVLVRSAGAGAATLDVSVRNMDVLCKFSLFRMLLVLTRTLYCRLHCRRPLSSCTHSLQEHPQCHTEQLGIPSELLEAPPPGAPLGALATTAARWGHPLPVLDRLLPDEGAPAQPMDIEAAKALYANAFSPTTSQKTQYELVLKHRSVPRLATSAVIFAAVSTFYPAWQVELTVGTSRVWQDVLGGVHCPQPETTVYYHSPL